MRNFLWKYCLGAMFVDIALAFRLQRVAQRITMASSTSNRTLSSYSAAVVATTRAHSHHVFRASDRGAPPVQKPQNSSAESSDEAPLNGPLLFRIENLATVPVNFMALSNAVRVHAEIKNDMYPSDHFEVRSVLGAYDFYLTTSSRNPWRKIDQVSWGLVKDGVSIGVGMFVGAGVSGSLAIGAGAAVTTALTAIVAPPVAIGIGIAAFVATGALTSLAVSMITETSFEAVASAMKALKQELSRNDDDLPAGNLCRFTQVVKESDVQEAFAMAIWREEAKKSKVAAQTRLSEEGKKEILRKIVMRHETAEAYFSALEAVFSTTRLGGNKLRKFFIAGGFTFPEPYDDHLKIVEFTPLHIAEDVPEHGCLVQENDPSHWNSRMKQCQSQCSSEGLRLGKSDSRANYAYMERCLAVCRRAVEKPVAVENLAKEIRARARALRGRKGLFVLDDRDEVFRAARAAGLSDEGGLDSSREKVVGEKIHVKSIAEHQLTAGVVLDPGGSKMEVTLPLEVLVEVVGGAPIFSAVERMELQQSTLGECWSRYDGGVGNRMAKLFSNGSWCYATSLDAGSGLRLHFGQPCSPAAQDECGNVKKDTGWHCIDE